MNVIGQVWLPAVLARIGAQREGSRARRAAFVCWICVPVYLLFSLWALGGWFIAVTDPTLDGRVLSYATLYGFVMTFVWISAAVYGLQLDHLRLADHRYVQLVLAGYAVTTALTCYLVGTLNLITGLVMMGAPLLGMMLFPLREILTVFSLAIIAILGTSIASALGHLPYAPVLNAGLATTSAPGLYYAMSGVVGAALYVTYEVLIMAALVAVTRAREEDVLRSTRTDPLTGLANRGHILDELGRLLAGQHHDGKPLAIVIVNIDGFREFSERHGLHAGDQALVAAAHALRQCLRSKDLIGRLNGDEFLVILPNTQAEAAGEIARRCQVAVSQSGIVSDGQRMVLSASTGVSSSLMGDAHGMDGLLRKAGEALASSRDTPGRPGRAPA